MSFVLSSCNLVHWYYVFFLEINKVFLYIVYLFSRSFVGFPSRILWYRILIKDGKDLRDVKGKCRRKVKKNKAQKVLSDCNFKRMWNWKDTTTQSILYCKGLDLTLDQKAFVLMLFFCFCFCFGGTISVSQCSVV